MESGPAERTFVTVDAAEAGITRAGEVAPLLADAAPPRAAHVGGDLPHPGRVVGRHGNSAAVDGCETRRSDFIGWEDGPGPLEAWGWGGPTLAGGAVAAPSESLARLPIVAFGTGAVEVELHVVTRGPVLAGVGLTGLRPAGNLLKSRRKVWPHNPEHSQGAGQWDQWDRWGPQRPPTRPHGGSGAVSRRQVRCSRVNRQGSVTQMEATMTSFTVYPQAGVKRAVFTQSGSDPFAM